MSSYFAYDANLNLTNFSLLNLVILVMDTPNLTGYDIMGTNPNEREERFKSGQDNT